MFPQAQGPVSVQVRHMDSPNAVCNNMNPSMKKIFRGKRARMIMIILGVVAGAGVGYLYYRFIGCRSGACFITSNPYRSMIYWAVFGGLLANLIR